MKSKVICHYGPTNSYFVSSPLGMIEVVCCGSGLHSLKFKDDFKEPCLLPDYNSSVKVEILDVEMRDPLLKTVDWLKNYFFLPGNLKAMDIPPVCNAIEANKSIFTTNVWKAALSKVPFGVTVSYGELAALAGENSHAARAVGNVMKSNTIPIIFPCHRIINSNGSFGNYSGGKMIKELLIKHEMKFKSGKA